MFDLIRNTTLELSISPTVSDIFSTLMLHIFQLPDRNVSPSFPRLTKIKKMFYVFAMSS